jgi:hypothetical protein
MSTPNGFGGAKLVIAARLNLQQNATARLLPTNQAGTCALDGRRVRESTCGKVAVVRVTNWLRSAGSPREVALKSRLRQVLGSNE